MKKIVLPFAMSFLGVMILLGTCFYVVNHSDQYQDELWEKVNPSTYRMAIEGGWIYYTYFNGTTGIVFVPKQETITGKL